MMADNLEEKKVKRLVLRRRHIERMTWWQEVANAVTQVVPSALFALEVARHEHMPLHAWVLVTSVWVHLPFSLVYHVECALRRDDTFDPLRCWSRRLDNSFIHVSAACIAFGTSHGSVPYLVACALFNAVAIARHWQDEVHIYRNQNMTLTSIMLYIAPMIWRRDVANLAAAMMSLFPAGMIFRTYACGGYSHAIFHVLMGLFAVDVLNSALGQDVATGSSPAAAVVTLLRPIY